MLEFVVLAAALGLAARLVFGCVPHDRVIQGVENGAAVAQYVGLLLPCKEKARAAHDYQVFEQCADRVDSMLCTINVAFCNDGGLP